MSEPQEKVRFIEHLGKRILYVDFSNAEPDEFLATMEQAEALIAEAPHNSLLTLTNVDHARHDRKVTDRLKTYVDDNKPYVKVGASSV